jgi:hypothetical protein
MGQQNFPVKQNNSFNAANSFVPSGSMAEGFPAFQEFTLPDNGIIDLSLPENLLFSRQNFGAANYDLRRPYVQSWNFAIQRSLVGGLVLDAAYVANHGVHNQSGWDYNAGRIIGAGNAGRPLNGPYGRTQSTNTNIGTHTYYNSLQVKLDRRFDNGFGLTTAYTWSKALNFSDDTGGLSINGLLEHFMSNKGRQGTDRTQVFTQSYQYELPFGRGKRYLQSGPGSWILGGWEVQGILALMTGEPFTITAPGSTLNAPGNQQRANVVGTPSTIGDIAGPGGTATFFTTDAFATPAQNTFGNGGREIIDGPGRVNLDFSLFRRFPLEMINEGSDLTLRIESFNFTNTPHFNNPNGDVSNGNFGRVTSAQDDPRQFQFALTLRF